MTTLIFLTLWIGILIWTLLVQTLLRSNWVAQFGNFLTLDPTINLGWLYTLGPRPNKLQNQVISIKKHNCECKGFILRSKSKAWKQWNGPNVASLSCRTSTTLSHEHSPPSLRNLSSTLGLILWRQVHLSLRSMFWTLRLEFTKILDQKDTY